MAAPKNLSGFARFATWAARATGHPSTFIFAVLIIIGWGVTGPMFHFSDTWQLVINTGTTIITFIMVFVIQNTQNRDSAAMQLKLDEIIRCTAKANNALLNMEQLDEKELEEIRGSYMQLAEDAGDVLRKKKGTSAGTSAGTNANGGNRQKKVQTKYSANLTAAPGPQAR